MAHVCSLFRMIVRMEKGCTEAKKRKCLETFKVRLHQALGNLM